MHMYVTGGYTKLIFKSFGLRNFQMTLLYDGNTGLKLVNYAHRITCFLNS